MDVGGNINRMADRQTDTDRDSKVGRDIDENKGKYKDEKTGVKKIYWTIHAK